MPAHERIFLSPPHMSGLELEFIADAFASNWVAPLGPQVDAFEREFSDSVGGVPALALCSGSAALHLALRLAGVERDDEVMVSTFTFAGSVFPICSLGARPVFIDSETVSWNMDPALLASAIEDRARRGRLPKAVVVVHIYGQSADLDAIVAVCRAYDVPLIEDAAEAVGTLYRGRSPGTFGMAGVYSFNGNKIITASGGGMLVCADPALLARARKLATQARDDAPHYQHSEVGYNYRLSNVLAGIGRGQLRALESRVAQRRRNFDFYSAALQGTPGVGFMPEAPWGRSTRWLTVMTIDAAEAGADREDVRLALESQNIEARPAWKPMHLQPVFAGCEVVGGTVAEDLFRRGLCLPSGSALTIEDLASVVSTIERRIVGCSLHVSTQRH